MVVDMDTPIIRISLFMFVLVFFALLENFYPRRRPGGNTKERWKTNFSISIISQVLLQLMLPLSAVLIAVLASGNNFGLFNNIEWPVFIEGALVFLLLDFSIYIQHVLSHKIPILWQIHKVHHSDRELDTSTAVRFHPLEIYISMLYKSIVIIVLGPSAVLVLIFEIVLSSSAIFNHANLKLPAKIDRLLRKTIVTPDMHRLHHSVREFESSKNYGFNFSFWDRIFDTHLKVSDEYHKKMNLGLESHQSINTDRLIWSLWLPFIKK